LRVTIDIDSKNPLILMKTLIMGTLKFMRFPYLFEKSRKGYHVGWHGMDITEREMLVARLALGDDKNRVRLDMMPNRIQQVLFDKKQVFYFKNGKRELAYSHGF
jgi:hypothetical protein